MRKALILILLFLAGCASQNSVVFHTDQGKVVVDVEIADEISEWQKGLMFRKSLGENKGMLFIYPNERVPQYWMKNTFIPLDIIFISADKKVVDIITAFECKKDPCPLYSPSASAKYVVEANALFAVKNGISRGDLVELP